jgi:hypothetical protein
MRERCDKSYCHIAARVCSRDIELRNAESGNDLREAGFHVLVEERASKLQRQSHSLCCATRATKHVAYR